MLAGEPLVQPSPIDTADEVGGAGALALDRIAAIRRATRALDDRDLRQTVGDFEAMGQLGRYYSAKIRGACELALFDAGIGAAHQHAAIAHLEDGLAAWRSYAAIHSAQYLPNFFARMGWVDISALTVDAARDIEIARTWRTGSLT